MPQMQLDAFWNVRYEPIEELNFMTCRAWFRTMHATIDQAYRHLSLQSRGCWMPHGIKSGTVVFLFFIMSVVFLGLHTAAQRQCKSTSWATADNIRARWYNMTGFHATPRALHSTQNLSNLLRFQTPCGQVSWIYTHCVLTVYSISWVHMHVTQASLSFPFNSGSDDNEPLLGNTYLTGEMGHQLRAHI